jgi:hypothetical protein
MSRREHCQACTFVKYGVKTRKNIPHTCGRSDSELRKLREEAKVFQELRLKNERERDKGTPETGD